MFWLGSGKRLMIHFCVFLYLYIDQFKHVLCEYLCFVELRNNLTVNS